MTRIVLFGASGLFFLPYLAPGLSSVPVVHALTHGLPSWDLSLLGPAGHGNAGFFSALVPLAAVHVPAMFGIGTLWLAVNALVCLGLARLALRR